MDLLEIYLIRCLRLTDIQIQGPQLARTRRRADMAGEVKEGKICRDYWRENEASKLVYASSLLDSLGTVARISFSVAIGSSGVTVRNH